MQRAIKIGKVDKEGTPIRVGDLVISGLLRQLWLVVSTKRARIVSDDSGMGHEEDADVFSLPKDNGTIIVGSILRHYIH